MISSLATVFAVTPAVLGLLGVTALLAGGASLIASGIRMSHGAVAQRVDLIKPRAKEAIDSRKGTLTLEKGLLRLRQQGLPEREQREIVRRLSKFGVPAGYAPSFLAASRFLAATGLALLMLMSSGHIALFAGLPLATPLAVAAAAVGGWLLPPAWVRLSARRRAGAVATGLPEALDLLVVCVEAGLSLEDALARVVTELGGSQPALADELALTSADLQILPSRDEALSRMAERVDLPSVRSVVTTLIQTLRYGTPLAQALRVLAAEMRNDALMKLEERANQLPALLTVPMMLFIMPTIFLIIGGPAALRVMDIFGR